MQQNKDAVDAFISYQSADEAFARKLATGIETYSFYERRLKVFFAPWDISPGTNIIAKIEESLQKAHFAIIILSPQAAEAEWPSAERAAAIYADSSGRLAETPTSDQRCLEIAQAIESKEKEMAILRLHRI